MPPVVVSAHVWSEPLAMAVKRPSGGVACLALLKPQQVAVPVVVSAHVWL